MSSAAMSKCTRPRVALLVDNLQHEYQNELWYGAHEQCCESDLDLYCISGEGIGTAESVGSVYALIGADDFDGIVMSTGTLTHDEPPEQVARFLSRFGQTPIVSIATSLDSIPSVVVDNRVSLKDMASHLIIAHGKRRIAMVRVTSPEGDQRFEGYREALEERGIEYDPALVVHGEFTWGSGIEAVRQLLDERQINFDSLIGSSDWIALGAIDELRRRGLHIPQDVAVTGFDDVENARFANPPLTSVRQPVRGLAIAAVRQLVRLMAGEEVEPIYPVRVEAQLRQSCGCGLPAFRGISVRPPSAQLDPQPPGDPVDVAAYLRVLRRAAPRLDHQLSEARIGALLAALPKAPGAQSDGEFLQLLADMLAGVGAFDCVPDWHDFVRALRVLYVSSLGTDVETILRVEAVCEQAHMLISAIAERVQGHRRMEREAAITWLNQMSRSFRASHDEADVYRAMAPQLTKLHIPRFYVMRENESGSPDATSEVAFLHVEGDSATAQRGLQFRTGDLVPAMLQPDTRHTMLVQRVCFGDGVRGYCVAEFGASIGLIYETIRELLDSGLQGAHLMRKVVAEVSRREQAERARLEAEMNLARRIQTEILPKSREVAGLELATVMIPATEVGGDYFDILPIAKGCWLGIGDVAGHGLDTGLIMLMIQSVVSTAVSSLGDVSPREIWRIVNRVIHENVRKRLGRDEHATLTLLKYSRSGLLEYCGAHEDLLIYRSASQRCETIPTIGVWTGILPEFSDDAIGIGSCQLEDGDVLVLYTDGVTEARNEERQMYGLSGLRAAVEAVGAEPVDVIKEHVMASVAQWASTIDDDRTLLVARFHRN